MYPSAPEKALYHLKGFHYYARTHQKHCHATGYTFYFCDLVHVQAVVQVYSHVFFISRVETVQDLTLVAEVH